MFKLSPRIQLIFDQLLPGEPVWDFCCDHGYLGLAAYRSGKFSEVHFVDRVPHIMQSLQARFHHKHYKDEYTVKAYFHTLSGEQVQLPLRGTVVISGVGSHTILDILKDKDLTANRRIVLVPQKDEEFLLESLQVNAALRQTHSLQKHLLVTEKKRERTLLVFDKMTHSEQLD